jgi:DNA topoisomerase-1
MQLAQSLYESGAITYHRTDSPHLADEAVRAIREYLTQAGQPLSKKPNQWAAKADAQEAHEAIRPVDLNQKHPSTDATTNKLYALIWRRTVASQMPNAVYDVLKVRCVGNVAVPLRDHPPAEFQATGRVLVAKGWLAIIQEHENENPDPENPPLPPLQVGEVYPCRGEVLDKQTQPPKRYTEAGLIKKLESLGIGRPSTYASILATLKKREYVRVERRLLHPMPVGEQVILRLRDSGFSFLRDDYTRAMESRLDDIARGQTQYLTVVRDGHGVLIDELSHLPAVPRQASRVRSSADLRGPALSGDPSSGNCRCGGAIVDRPKSWTCSVCQATVWKESFGKKLTLKQAQGLLSGKVIALKGLKSKAGTKYDAKAVLEEGKVKLIFDSTKDKQT